MSVSIHQFSKLVTLIHAAPHDARLWQDFLHELTRTCDGVATHIIGFDGQGDEDGNIASGYDDGRLMDYAEHFAALNAWAPGFLPKPIGEVVDSREMCPDDSLFETEFYNDWVKPQDDIRFGGGLIVSRTPDRIFAVGGNIPSRLGDDAAADWLELLRLLAPHLTAAWKTAEALTSARLGTMDTPVVVLGDDGQLVFANGVAQSLFAQGDVLRVGATGRISFRDPEADRWLDATLAGLRAGDLAGAIAPRDLGAWDARLSLVHSDLLDATWPLALARLSGPGLVLSLTPRRSARSQIALLSRNLGLTPSEASVALALATGQTPREISESRSVSHHTTRDQIKAAMFKTGTRRQSQLVSTILQTLATEHGL